MPRVLLTGFCAVPGPRRAGVQLRHVIRALTPHHSVDLLVVREGDQPYVERQGSVRVLRVPTHEADLRSQIQAFQRALKRQLDGADYDVVHCRDSWAGQPVLEARARLGYATVYDLSRSPLGETTYDAELDAQYARDEDACLLAADLILAPTAAAVKALQNRGKPQRVVLSPPGVDIDRFDWEEPPTGGPPRILYAGSIDPGRGVRVVVRAMASIVREVDARLVLAGSMAPAFEQPLRDAIRELKLVDKVEIAGPVDHDQLPALIASATVCVVPAAADLTPTPMVTFPTKLLEYMACRRAVVAPRRETVAQVVEHGREALLFEPGDPVDLARKVLRLLGEPLLRDRIAQQAYERVRRDFTASATRRGLKAAYRTLIERFGVPMVDAPSDAPKIELLADDDFEATLFEEAPAPPPGVVEPLEDALHSLSGPTGAHEATASTSSESIAPPSREDETMERAPVLPRASDAPAWTVSSPSGPDDWVVTNVGQAVRGLELPFGDDRPLLDGRGMHPAGSAAEWQRGLIDAEELEAELLVEEGTPIEGVIAVAPALPVLETTFVAGEIDVPAPRPTRARVDDTPAVEFTAASTILGPSDQSVPIAWGQGDGDPDTGSRTPPIERR